MSSISWFSSSPEVTTIVQNSKVPSQTVPFLTRVSIISTKQGQALGLERVISTSISFGQLSESQEQSELLVENDDE